MDGDTTMIETTSETVSLADVHDLDDDAFTSIHVDVRRRAEPGAGAYSGARLLSGARVIASFDTVDGVLTFIDDMHDHGLITAVMTQLDAPDPSRADAVDALDLSIDDASPDEFITQTGCDDPFNLDYTIYVERTTMDVTNGHAIPVDGHGMDDAQVP